MIVKSESKITQFIPSSVAKTQIERICPRNYYQTIHDIEEKSTWQDQFKAYYYFYIINIIDVSAGLVSYPNLSMSAKKISA